MPNVLDLPIPQNGMEALPAVPEANTVQPDPDASTYQLTAGPFQKGLRSGFNQLGAMANAFLGSMADSVGLSTFAAERMKDAEEQVKFAESVGPQFNDVRQLKDAKSLADYVDYITGITGQNVATMAPAVLGAGVGRAAMGLRGAYAGAAAGSFIPNAGEQAMRIKNAPASPQQKALNVLGTGAATSALDMLAPGGVVGHAGKKGATGILKEAGKNALLEGGTEGLQEAIGQGMHTQLEPNRDKSGDTDDIVNNVVAGALGGGVLGGTGAAVSKVARAAPDAIAAVREKVKGKQQTADDVEKNLNFEHKPVDEEDLSDIIADPNVTDEQSAMDAIEEKGRKATDFMAKMWDKLKDNPEFQKYKDFATDPEVRKEFSDKLKQRYDEMEVEPKLNKWKNDIKSFVKGASDRLNELRKQKGESAPKESKQRTAMDFAIYDNMLKHLPPEIADKLSPQDKMDLADRVKFIAMYEHGKLNEIEGPGAPDEIKPFNRRPLKSFDDAKAEIDANGASRIKEGPRQFARTIPEGLMQIFGENTTNLLNETNEILGKGGVPRTDFKPIIKEHSDLQSKRDTFFEDLVRGNLRAEVAANPEARDRAAKILAPRLLDVTLRGPGGVVVTKKRGGMDLRERDVNQVKEAQFQAEMEYAFGKNKDYVLSQIERMRQRMTTQPETFFVDDEATPKEEQSGEDESVVREAEAETTGAKDEGPFGDKRLGVPIRGLEEARKVKRALESEYNPNRVAFTVQQTEDGRYTVEAKERAGEDPLSDEEWANIRDQSKKGANLKEGIVTVQMKDGTQRAISLVRLTSHMMKITPRVDTGRVNYIYDIVSRGLSRLLADPNVKGLNEATMKQTSRREDGGFDLPDDTRIAYKDKEFVTWGDIKKRVNINPDELEVRRLESNSVEQAQEAQNLDEIRDIYRELNSKVKEYEAAYAAAKIEAAKKKSSKANRAAAIAFNRVERLRGAQEKILSEVDRRGEEGDAPRSDIKGLVEDTRQKSGLAVDAPNGARLVESDTGTPLTGPTRPAGERGPVKERTAGPGPSEAGIPERDRVSGKPRIKRTEMTPEQEAAFKEENKRLEADSKAKGKQAPKPGKGPAKMSLMDNQKVALLKRIKESEPQDWRKFLDKVEQSNNVQALNDTLEFLDDREQLEALNDGLELEGRTEKRVETLKSTVFNRMDAIEYGSKKLEKALDPKNLKDTDPVWAVTEHTDDLSPGAVLAIFKDMNDAQAYSEAVLGTVEQNLMGKLRPRIKKESTQNIGLVGEVSNEEKERVRAFIQKILGKKAEVLFANMASAGTFAKIDGVESIRISTMAMDAMGVGRHEAAHALMSRLLQVDPKSRQILIAAAGSPTVITRLRQLLKDHPNALKQLSDPEERLAYMYQFWGAGQLRVGPNTESVFNKVASFFKRALGAWSETFNDYNNVEKAEKVFELFESGALAEPSVTQQVLREKMPKAPFEQAQEIMPHVAKFVEKVLFTAEARVRAINYGPFTDIVDKMYTPVGHQDKGPGYVQTRYVEMNKFQNKFSDVIEGSDKETLDKAIKVLRGFETSTDPKVMKVVNGTRKMLNEVFQYMKDKGVKVVEWNEEREKYEEHDLHYIPDYFPRAFDRMKINEDKEGFIKMLTTAQPGYETPMDAATAKQVMDKILRNTKVDPDENDFTAGLTYFAPSAQNRTLSVPDKVLMPYLHQDLVGAVNSYLNYATRRGEYASRFGNQGQEIEQAAKDAKAQGIKDEDIKTFNQAMMAMEGSLGFDIKPQMKQIMGGIVTYQNFRLLPLALFTSLVDPIGIAVRGGGMKEAFSAFTRGLRNIIKENKDDAYELAKLVGAISTSNDAHMLADSYGTQYLTNWQRRANEFMFKWNGMEKWNRSMRVAATAAAQRFIIKHATKPTEHSERYLRELGLTNDDIKVNADGTLELNDKVKQAITQWVDGAVLRPNAAVRPVWMSDPHWMVIAHLKQFTYSFQKTIVARVVHEMNNGNYTSAYALLSYVPLLMASDIMRAFLTPGGGDDDALKRLDLAGLLWRGTQRAGLLGPGQYALDAYGDLGHGKIPVASILGPSVQQLYDFGKAAAGAGSVTQEFKKAIPGYVLVR